MIGHDLAAFVAELDAEQRAVLARELRLADLRSVMAEAVADLAVDSSADTPPAAPADAWPPTMDAATAARYLRVGINQLRDLARVGEIPSRRSGRRLLFGRDALDEWASEQARAEQRQRLAVVGRSRRAS